MKLCFQWLMCCLLPATAIAQDSAVVLTSQDSAMVYRQVMEELAALGFVGKPKADLFDVTLGYGNGNFSQKAYLQQISTPLPSGYFSANAAFLHRSGLGLALNINVINEAEGLNLFQWSVNPSYDFSNTKLATGISFSRYFNKDSLSFYVSPLVNDVYAYLLLKPGWLQPKLAVDFGWGNYDERENLRYLDTNRFPRLKPAVRSLSKTLGVATVYDISFLLSVKHAFKWDLKRDQGYFFQLTPSLSTVAGTAKYGSNLAISNAAGVRSVSAVNAQRYLTKYRDLFPEPDERFLWQNANAGVTGLLNLGAFYLQAQVTLSYAIPSAYSGWTTFYNMACGVSF
jgi:hypothetical protein